VGRLGETRGQRADVGDREPGADADERHLGDASALRAVALGTIALRIATLRTAALCAATPTDQDGEWDGDATTATTYTSHCIDNGGDGRRGWEWGEQPNGKEPEPGADQHCEHNVIRVGSRGASV